MAVDYYWPLKFTEPSQCSNGCSVMLERHKNVVLIRSDLVTEMAVRPSNQIPAPLETLGEIMSAP